MKNITPFQIGIYIACGIGIIGAVLLFSGRIPIGNKGDDAPLSGSIVMWGTLPFDDMNRVLETFRQQNQGVSIRYVVKDPTKFQNELVNAHASGSGPDLITVSLPDIISNKARLVTVPFASLPETLFRTTFIDQGELYINNEGTVAFPFIVDPLVMFYNRDMLTSSFTVAPPTTWDEIIALNKKVTQKDDAGSLATETVALGTFDNITHAKELITTMVFQAGNRLVKFDPEQKKYVSTFAEAPSNNISPTASALEYYTSFADPNNPDRYSWNRTLINDKNQFLAGKLAIYFGYATETPGIRERNPNLNFGVAMMPQRASSPVKITYGNMTGIAVLKMSKNLNLAFAVAQALVKKESVAAYLSENKFIAPARKDMLTTIPDDAIQSMIYKSAIISRGFLDPDPVQTSAFFRRAIDQINSGLARPESVVSTGSSLFTSILNNVQK